MKLFKRLFRPVYFYLLIVVICSGMLSSCGRPLYEQAFGSLDVSSQKQGGDSQEDDIIKTPTENLGVLMALGLGEGGAGMRNDVGDFASDSKMKNDNFQFMTGLEYVGKGYKVKASGFKSTTHLNYLEVPLDIVYEHPLSTGAFFAGAGPWLAYGIGGKIKSGGNSLPSFGEDNGGFKRFDFGLAILAGYRIHNGFCVHIAYDYGLANIGYASQDFTARNRSFSFNIGYDLAGLLGGKKSKVKIKNEKPL